jgi:tRNA (guanine37-N1)-methyltransferase
MIFELPRQEMLKLNKALFSKTFSVPAVKISKQLSGTAKKQLTPLQFERIPSIFQYPNDPTSNILLLNDAESAAKDATTPFFLDNKLELEEYSLSLDYEYWSTSQVLKAILPEGLIPPSSFECVGHIAHLNLGSEYEDYKKLIAEVILDVIFLSFTLENKESQNHRKQNGQYPPHIPLLLDGASGWS